MAFAIRDLSVLAYANGFTLWHYKAGDTPSTVVASDNFFQDANDMMAAGDMVMVSGTKGCSLLCIAFAEPRSVISAPLS